MSTTHCTFCGNPLGKDYVTLLGPEPKHVFQACWECCGPDGKTQFDGVTYHPSYHHDGPPNAA